VRRDLCDLRRQQKMEREEAAVTCDGRLFHRRAAATGNALSPTVDCGLWTGHLGFLGLQKPENIAFSKPFFSSGLVSVSQ